MNEQDTQRDEFSAKTAPCIYCGTIMSNIKGSKAAVCTNCGFKDSCCF